jgi:hypothetical protein
MAVKGDHQVHMNAFVRRQRCARSWGALQVTKGPCPTLLHVKFEQSLDRQTYLSKYLSITNVKPKNHAIIRRSHH